MFIIRKIMKIVFSIVVLFMFLSLNAQEAITNNNKLFVTRYKVLPNVFTGVWAAGTGTFTTVGTNTPEGYIQCTSAGTAYILSTQAYGTWEFNYYKGAENSYYCNGFISSNTSNPDASGTQTGYQLDIQATEQIRLTKRINGVGTILFATNTSYISLATWYSFKITRSSTGVFTAYIKGGTFGNEWTLITATVGTNPATDNIIKTSINNVEYFTVPGDRIRNFRFLPLNQNKLSIIKTE